MGYSLDNEEYNPSGDSWTGKTNVIQAKTTRGWAAISKCYEAYGYGGTSVKDCHEYDPSGDSWAGKTDGPTPVRGRHSVFGINDIGYVVSGQDDFSSPANQLGVDAFDASGDSWTSKTDLSDHQYDGYGMAVGGLGYNQTGTGDTLKNEQYTPSSDSWSTKADLPSPSRKMGGCANLG